MKLAVEVLYAVNHTLVLAWSTLRSIQVPLNTNPNRITSFGIVKELSNITNTTNVLSVLEPNVLVEKVLFLIFVLYTDSFTKQVFVLR